MVDRLKPVLYLYKIVWNKSALLKPNVLGSSNFRSGVFPADAVTREYFTRSFISIINKNSEHPGQRRYQELRLNYFALFVFSL